MNDREKYIAGLITRFFDGETTIQEEKIIYDFFLRNEVSAELEKYREIFGFFENSVPSYKPEPSITRGRRAKTVIRYVVSAAAVLLIAFLPMRSYWHTNGNEQIIPEEGSYIVRNGKVIFDEKLIEEEERKIYDMLSDNKTEMDRLLLSIFYPEEDYSHYYKIDIE